MGSAYMNNHPSAKAVEYPFEGPEFDVRLNPEMTTLPYSYTYLVLKKGSFVIGNYSTWLQTYREQDGDTFQVFETEEAAQIEAYEYVQEQLSTFADSVPFGFPTGKEISFQRPCLLTSII